MPGGLFALLSLAAVGRFGDTELTLRLDLALALALLPAIIASIWLSAYTARALDRPSRARNRA